MSKIATLSLSSTKPAKQIKFFRDILRMTEFADGSVGYGINEARITFPIAKSAYKPVTNDLYWKIAISVPNIELACDQLKAKGIEIEAPRQFQDIGFLTHFTDPEGYTIELIEHWFQGNRQEGSIASNLLGGGPHLNLITLRTPDIEPIQRDCKNWNMKPLSIQPVESHGFTLYFFAFTDDTPPSANLYAVENREWLYQRKYTILEVQHVHNATNIRQPAANQAGYMGIAVSGHQKEIKHNELMISSVIECGN